VVCPELSLETVHGAAERACHDPCVVDEHVDCLVGRHVGVGKRRTVDRSARSTTPNSTVAAGTSALITSTAPAARSRLRASSVTEAP
jgi:hypothetical protein